MTKLTNAEILTLNNIANDKREASTLHVLTLTNYDLMEVKSDGGWSLTYEGKKFLDSNSIEV